MIWNSKPNLARSVLLVPRIGSYPKAIVIPSRIIICIAVLNDLIIPFTEPYWASSREPCFNIESSSACSRNTDLDAFCTPTPPPAINTNIAKIQIFGLNIAKKKNIVDIPIPIKKVFFVPFLFNIQYANTPNINIPKIMNSCGMMVNAISSPNP